MHEEELKEFEELTKPLVEYLRRKHDPHTTIIISYDHAKITQDTLEVPFAVED